MTEDQPYNASDPKDVAVASKREVWLQQRLEQALFNVLQTPTGRLVLHDFIVSSGVLDDIRPGPMVEYLLGRRSVGLDIRAAIVAMDPTFLDMMEREAAYEPVFERIVDEQTGQ